MAKNSLVAYKIGIAHDLGSDRIRLDDLNGVDLYDVFSDYFNSLNNGCSLAPERMRFIRVSDPQRSDNRRELKGILSVGEYGYTSELHNVETDKPSYTREVPDAEMLPFYYLIKIPRGFNIGIALFQRIGLRAIQADFSLGFSSFFELRHHELQRHLEVLLQPLMPTQIVKELLQQGRIPKIRFVKRGIPSDRIDILSMGGLHEESGELELHVKTNRGGNIQIADRIQQFFRDNRNPGQLLELQDFPYDTIKVELDVGGSQKTIDLGDFGKIRANYDIDDDVEIGADGHPTFESIDQTAHDLLDRLYGMITGTD